jgi:hypothetical protein
MAVTKTLTKATPYNKDSKVQQWFFEMKYEEGDKTLDEETGEYTYAANYYTSTMSTSIPASETLPDGSTQINFTPKAEGEWTLAQLTALCPVSFWDTIFASQYDNVITNPLDVPVADPSYVIPS